MQTCFYSNKKKIGDGVRIELTEFVELDNNWIVNFKIIDAAHGS